VASPLVRLDVDDAVAVLLLDRAEALNALSLDLVAELGRALDAVAASGARALVLGGAGRAFCAGADLGLVRGALDGDPAAVLAPLVDGLHAVIRRLGRLAVPTVAALEGSAVGAGMGLALACDLRVAARSARLLPGYFGIGASPDGGVSYFLARAVGGPRALSILLRQRALRADELLTLGLVEEVTDDGAALAAATALAGTLTRTPPLALVRARRLLESATAQGLSGQLDSERALVAELWPSSDFREGVGAFLDKRQPAFTGR